MPTPAAPVECQFQEYVPGINCTVDCKDACQGVKAYLEIKRRERTEKLAAENKANPPLPSLQERDANNAQIASRNNTGNIQYRGERVKNSD